MECPYCGGTNVFYEGVADGLGPYGDCIGDLYYCADCEQLFEGALIPYSDFVELPEGDEDAEGSAPAWRDRY